MPITAEDVQPFINPSSIPAAPNNYYNGAVGSTGGPQSPNNSGGFLPNLNPFYSGSNSGIGGIISNPATNPGAFLDPVGTGLLASLFGGNQSTFKPYINAQGNYVWTDPNQRNPVPIANLPGASLSPNKTYRDSANSMQAIYNLLPYLNQAVNQGAVPTAVAQLQASQATSPGYAQMMTQLYNTYGSQLNEIGNQIQNRNALAQANTENQVLTGPGKDLVGNAYNLAQVFDKPYYDTRALGASRMSDLLNSIDLSGGLSPTERNEIAQGISRTGVQNGTINAPSQSNAVANAMQYGNAGYQRTQQAKSNLSDALSKASAFLPASKSGVDVFQVATGRSSTPNPGNAQFPGVNTNTSAGVSGNFGLAGSTLGDMTQMGISQDQIFANKKDWLDQFNQFASGLGSLTGSATKVAGLF